jgi:hypothetical protein
MQVRQYIQGQVDWNRVGNDSIVWLQSLSAQVSSSHIFDTLGIPATSGLAIGLVAGLAKSRGRIDEVLTQSCHIPHDDVFSDEMYYV